MLRRDFLRRLTATVAGILVADDALELLTKPRRKYWPGADVEPISTADVLRLLYEEYVPATNAYSLSETAYLRLFNRLYSARPDRRLVVNMKSMQASDA